MKSSAAMNPARGGNAEEVSWNRQSAFHAAVFLVSFLVLLSRRPDAILNAQFYAEDGARWYADAYHMGWHCLLLPETGYLQTVSRLIGVFSLLFPFAVAPLVMNLCALAVQILPVNLFLSARFSAVPFKTRLIGSLLYLAIPNSIEIHANTTNIQWHLALLGCLVLLARPAEGRVWTLLDLTVLTLVAVDSPLGFVLVPIAAALWRRRRDLHSKWYFAALVPGTVLQLLILLFSQSHAREPVLVGATVARLTGILGGQIVLSSVLGVRTFAQLFLFGDRRLLFFVEAAAMIAGLMLVVYSFRSAPAELKLFLVFAAGVLLLAVSHPIAGPDRDFPQWEYLQIPGRSSRYYFFPILAFYASLLSVAGASAVAKGMRYLALAFLMLLPVGIYRDWRYPQFVDLQFQSFAAAFERATPGTRIAIPINPVGWEMQLTKH
jgi:hypothetical protein